MYKLIKKHQKKEVIFLFILVVVSAVLSFVPIKVVELLVNDSVINNSETSTILMIGLGYIFIQLSFSAIKSISDYLISRFQITVSSNIQKILVDKVLKMDLKYLMQKKSSEIVNSLIDDINVVSDKYLEAFKIKIWAVTSFTIGVVYIYSINEVLALIIIPLGFITATLNWYTHKKFINIAQSKKEVSISLWKSFSEIFMGILPIRIFKNEGEVKNSVKVEIQKLKEISTNQKKLESLNYFVASSLFMLSIGVILTVSSVMVSEGMILIGSMVAILMYNHMITDPLIDILETRQIKALVSVSIGKIKNILDTPDDENVNLKRGNVDKIILKNVQFGYNDKIMISNINLDIHSNEKIAIFGKTGSGKSTLVKVIAGLFNASRGDVLFFSNGKKVDFLPTISYLYQDFYLFDNSIIYNIKLANPRIDDNDLNDVIEKCQVDKILEIHGNKNIGEGGSLLSGGERARIRLAMTLVRTDASIYIFDELSSSLDSETINIIFENIIDFLSGRICIFVEHNDFIMKYVDRAIYLKDGEIIASNETII
ncbi:MAG: ABC transporter transmembrane domain-containing protein [Erysipelotrichaceae bacterium]